MFNIGDKVRYIGDYYDVSEGIVEDINNYKIWKIEVDFGNKILVFDEEELVKIP